MNIYFAGSIRGGRRDRNIYLEIIEHLKNYGNVLTEHIGDEKLDSFGEHDINDRYIHDRDMHWLLKSDIMIAEVTNPSLGVGYEIGRALENNKKIICLFRENDSQKLSAMISGAKKLNCIKYIDINDFKNKINQYLNN
tara:strand:+ start:796 stop:1209 length:414 start_codon:yes stop_codon:yes gene_type:complete